MDSLLAAALTLIAVGLYGALHSLLATHWAKALARQLLGPTADRLYRLLYNLIGGLSFLPVLAVVAWQPGTTLYTIPLPWSAVAVALQALALALILIGLLQTGITGFLGLRQLLQPALEEPAKLEVSGLYRWVRHPLYTAGLIFIWLSPIMTTSSLALTVGLTAYIYIGSIFEERRLVTEFGQAYLDYQRRVPRLLPIRLTRNQGA